MKPKGAKQFVAGLLAGMLLMAAVPVLAESEQVIALIDKTIKLEIAGESKTLPEDYEVLNYKGYTYLPSRYVAEELGCTVRWNESERRITISEPPEKTVEVPVEVIKEVEKIVYVDRDSSYQGLPTSATAGGVSLTVNSIIRLPLLSEGPCTRVMVELKNNSEGAVNVDYASATLSVDGKLTKTAEVSSLAWDQTFIYNDVAKGGSHAGQFSFPLADAGTKNFILTVPVRNQNDGSTTTLTVRFTATLPDNS